MTTATTVATPATPQAAPAKKRSPVLMPERFGTADEKRQDFVADVQADITVADILEPSFWSHLAPQMTAGDVIEVRTDDFKWIAQLRVQYAERNFARVRLERLFEIADNAVIPNESVKYKVEHKGPHYKFSVVRLSDSEIIHSGCKTREEAHTWMVEYEKATRI